MRGGVGKNLPGVQHRRRSREGAGCAAQPGLRAASHQGKVLQRASSRRVIREQEARHVPNILQMNEVQNAALDTHTFEGPHGASSLRHGLAAYPTTYHVLRCTMWPPSSISLPVFVVDDLPHQGLAGKRLLQGKYSWLRGERVRRNSAKQVSGRCWVRPLAHTV